MNIDFDFDFSGLSDDELNDSDNWVESDFHDPLYVDVGDGVSPDINGYEYDY